MKLLALLLAFIGIESVIAQETAFENRANQLNGFDPTQYQEHFEELRQHKLYLNFCSIEDLGASQLLNIYQINNLIQYRERSGKLYSLAELNQIKGFNPELIQKLKPFIDLSLQPPAAKFYLPWEKGYTNHEVYWRWGRDLQLRRGFREDAYLGDSWDSSLRYRYKNGRHLRIGMQLQKDPGEPWESESNLLGHDHASFFAEIKNALGFRKIILGDFKYDFGQGLCLSSGSLGGGLFKNDLKLYAQGIRAYAGNDENRFFRGCALEYQQAAWLWAGFISIKNQDGRLLEEDQAYSLQLNESGLHRTASEIAQINQFKRYSWSLSLAHENQRWQWGLLYFAEEEKDAVSNRSLVPRTIHHHFSGHWNIHKPSFRQWGEVTFRNDLNPLKPTTLLGLETPIIGELKASLVLFSQPTNNPNIWMNNPHFAKADGGEQGIQAQISHNWTHQQESLISMRHCRFRGPTYLNEGPGIRKDYALQHLGVARDWRFKIQAHFTLEEFFQKHISQEELQTEKSHRNLVQLKLKKNLGPNLDLVYKIVLSSSKSEENRIKRGYLISTGFSITKQRWVFKTGLAISKVREWQSRIYNYEPDLPYSFSLPAFGGISTRHYALIRFPISKVSDLHIKYALWYYHDRETLSSGWQEINKPYSINLKLALRIKL